MARSELVYHKLASGQSSHLSFNDSKEYISYLHGLPISSFELIIKASAGHLDLIIGLPKDDLNLARKHLYAISPGLSLIEVRRSFLIKKPSINLNFRFKRHYAYPLADASKASEQPHSILLGQLSQLENNQVVELCLEAKPNAPLRATILRRRLLLGQSPYLGSSDLRGYLLTTILGMLSILKEIGRLTNNIFIVRSKTAERRPPKPVQAKNITSLDKLYEPLFKTALNIRIKAASPKQSAALARQLYTDLNNYARGTGYQSFKESSRRHLDIYSASDLAAFYNFSEQDTKSGLIPASQFKVLPTPSEYLVQHRPGDLVLGSNSYKGQETELVLSQSARQRHLYITGATGSGKSTLLKNLIYQDMAAGHGLSLIDPHGDLAEEVMAMVPKNRRRDVIYFDPSSLLGDLSINLLELRSDPASAGYKLEADQVTESVLSIFRKLFSDDDSGGHRIEYILRNCVHSALDLPDSTIFTIFRLLNDSSFRLEAVSKLKDPNLISFWRGELGRAGDYQRVKMTAGVTSKIGRLLFYEPARQVFGQPKSTLHLDKAIDEKKIIICNFSKGRLGEDGSKLFATAVLSKLQLAALARHSVAPESRTGHYLYLDEFQNYTPSVVIQMLSEARKYGLYLTMAEQSPSQQDSLAMSVILANVGSLICFRTASPRDERLLLPSFDNYLSLSDLNNLPAFHFYLKSIAEEVMPPVSGHTYWQPVNYPVSGNINVNSLKRPDYRWSGLPSQA